MIISYKKPLIVQQIFLVSTIGNVKRTQKRITVLIYR